MKPGPAPEIARFFDNTVEINMPQKNNSYSKSQAELVLKDFFSTNPVKAFEIIHKGENSGSQYCIGTLITKNGSFRTTIFMKQKGDKQVLQEITFENKWRHDRNYLHKPRISGVLFLGSSLALLSWTLISN